MNERLVKIMEMITAEGVKASLDLDLWGRLAIYLWDETTSITKHFVIRNVNDLTDGDVDMVSAMIEAYKKNLSLPAKHNAEI